MTMFLVINGVDVELGGGHSVPLRLLKAERCPKVKAPESVLKGVPVRSSIQEGAYGHITANTRECVKIADFHVNPSLLAGSKAVPSLAGQCFTNEQIAGAESVG